MSTTRSGPECFRAKQRPAWSAVCLGALLLVSCETPRTGVALVSVDTLRTFQTMSGWEATAQADQGHTMYPRYRDTLIALAVRDLGLNRLRLEIRSGSEHTRDYFREGRQHRLVGDAYRCARYETLNDNDDPRRIEPSGFRFTELDETIESLVLPFQRALAADNQRLMLTVTYVSFFRQCPRDRRYDHRSAEEYAEFVLATVLHMREKFDLLPQQWEVILEPDNTDDWSGDAIGRAMVAAATRLREHRIPMRFIAPSNTSMLAALRYYDVLRRVPGATAVLGELSYHRYRDVSPSTLQAIGDRSRRDSVRTAMLEHIGSDVDDLFEDVIIGNVSAWSQYVLAFDVHGQADDGGVYYRIDSTDSLRPVVREGARTRFLRQVFRTARLGAVRVGTASDDAAVRALAFRNVDRSIGVAIRARRAAPLHVSGLPAGDYAITFATESVSHGSLPTVRLANHDTLRVGLPAPGVLTIRSIPTRQPNRPTP